MGCGRDWTAREVVGRWHWTGVGSGGDAWSLDRERGYRVGWDWLLCGRRTRGGVTWLVEGGPLLTPPRPPQQCVRQDVQMRFRLKQHVPRLVIWLSAKLFFLSLFFKLNLYMVVPYIILICVDESTAGEGLFSRVTDV